MNLDTLSSDSSAEEIRDSGRSFQSLAADLRLCFRICKRHSIINRVEAWSGVLEWSEVKFEVKFGGDLGVDF